MGAASVLTYLTARDALVVYVLEDAAVHEAGRVDAPANGFAVA